ncbi:MAG TPA: polysaccharide biosynthesis/export family protein [Candidatus Acidoferrum sp.]|jgi:protein involved in polysaccharide export with SLBB domain
MLEPKTFWVCFAATLLISSAYCCEALSAQEKERSPAASVQTYRIAVGDRIRVEVWQHPELSRTVVVDHEGKVTLPAVRAVKVAGLSMMDLLNVMQHKFQLLVPNVQVTVVVGNGQFSPSPMGPALPYECCVAKIG